MRINTNLLLIALLNVILANCFLWKLPIIYELHKNNGNSGVPTQKFSICKKKNNALELSSTPNENQKKILIIPPIDEPLDWECGEISWDLDDEDDKNSTSVKNNKIPTPPPDSILSASLEPMNVGFLFV